MIIRVATAEDIRRHYEENGGTNYGYTMRVVTAEHEGRIMGLAGTYRQADGMFVAFSEMVDEMRNHKKDIVRVTRMVMKMIQEKGTPVLALCTDERALAFCKAQGFEEYVDSINGKVIKWRKQSRT